MADILTGRNVSVAPVRAFEVQVKVGPLTRTRSDTCRF